MSTTCRAPSSKTRMTPWSSLHKHSEIEEPEPVEELVNYICNTAATTTSTTSTRCFSGLTTGSKRPNNNLNNQSKEEQYAPNRRAIVAPPPQQQDYQEQQDQEWQDAHSPPQRITSKNKEAAASSTKAVYRGYAAQLITSCNTRMRNRDATIKNPETQLGRIANLLVESCTGTLPSNTQNNPVADQGNRAQ
ncbi:hypothetical protein Dimus_030189 [Dionaea muscipula]